MDALSDVLRAVRLTGAVFFDVEAAEPWVAASPDGSAIVAKIFPGTEHLIPYHAVTRGHCWAKVGDDAPVKLATGDIIMFPHGDAHTLSSAPGMSAKPNLSMYRTPSDGQLPFAITMGEGSGAPAQVVCGYLGCDARPFNPLLAALPRAITMTAAQAPTGGALAAYLRFALAESKTPRLGGEGVLSRLSELMFVDVVRHYLESLPPDQMDWLAGLRDPFVGRALAALHRSPARAWTLQALARSAGLSRSALAERFTHFVGRPPMHYLASWRMQLAANHLLSGNDSVAAIAEHVGYDSEAAFSRAFKKVVGAPPSHWRRERRGEAP